MAERRLGLIMHGVTGRMGTNQHLVRSVAAIRAQGGVLLSDGTRVQLDPILIGRNADKVAAACQGTTAWSAGPPTSRPRSPIRTNQIFFDAGDDADAPDPARTGDQCRQAHLLREADLDQPAGGAAHREARPRQGRQERHGAGQAVPARPDQAEVAARFSGFFGKMLSVRGEFGYWVFEGDWQAAQRPSWNYRNEDGGGMILDMVCHWRYVLDNLFGQVQSVSCLGATHIPRALGRERQALQGDGRRRGLRDLPARGRCHRPHEHELGDAASIATTSSLSMSTARWVRRWRACTTA
jgi:hypothetical protein